MRRGIKHNVVRPPFRDMRARKRATRGEIRFGYAEISAHGRRIKDLRSGLLRIKVGLCQGKQARRGKLTSGIAVLRARDHQVRSFCCVSLIVQQSHVKKIF